MREGNEFLLVVLSIFNRWYKVEPLLIWRSAFLKPPNIDFDDRANRIQVTYIIIGTGVLIKTSQVKESGARRKIALKHR